MKKIRDFIYDFSDIFTTLLVIAIAGSIIFWRVQVIMGYSKTVEDKNPTEIDIDFSDVDLTPIEETDDDYIQGDVPQEGGEEVAPEPPKLVIDENFKSTKQVAVAINYGDGYTTAIRRVAQAYEFTDDDYFVFYNLLWDKGIAMGADYCIMPGTFTIPAGSSLEDIIRTISSL